jgi:SAM-dependent MidA family methyltransferase
MERALYGVGGFYRREGAAARHFRTSVHASARFAAAITTLLCEVDRALGQPGQLDVVDMGSGSGRLLTEVHAQAQPQLREQLRLTAVERGPRPSHLPTDILWTQEPPDAICGLIVANEWLDNVPVDVVELTDDGPRMVLVETTTGTERIGDRPDEQDSKWLAEWWPLAEEGHRAEIGWPRDEAWADLVGRLHRGLAVAIDYGHRRDDRPPFGSLTGYRDGRQVAPVPDGSCDITAYVALDACATRTGTESALTTQRWALKALGVEGRRPQPAGKDPRTYLDELRTAGEEGELIDPAGLGGFGWLIHTRGMPIPAALRDTIDG